MALVEAARDYDPNDGEFSTVACRQMQQAIIDSYRRRERQKRKGKLDKGAKLDDVPSREEHEPIPSDLLYQFLADHPSESKQDRSDKLLLIEVFLGGNKVSDIAERLCVSRPTIYNRIERCLAKIRERHPDLLERYQEAFQ
jgi:RNA polymerase sigma factor (sigma-70 family)